MEQIETQASDLRYLTQPVAPVDSSRIHESPPSSTIHGNTSHRRTSSAARQQQQQQQQQQSPYALAHNQLPPAYAHQPHLSLSPSPYGSSLHHPTYPRLPVDDGRHHSADGRDRVPPPFVPAPTPTSALHDRHNSNTNTANTANSPPAASQSPGGYASGASSAKRKPDDDESTTKQQRSKRNRYISIACNECKRRKIKCNGETPCKRCGHLSLACLYTPNCCSNSFKDSDEYKQMTAKMNNLEEQLAAVLRAVDGLLQERQEHQEAQPQPQRHAPPTRQMQQAFRGGPTSTAFAVDVAKNTLHNMGYSGEGLEEPGGPVVETSPTTHAQLQSPSQSQSQLQSQPQPQPTHSDPLWVLFDKDEMIRLCRLHEDEVGIMYPVVKIESVIEHAQNLCTTMEAETAGKTNYDDAMTDIRTLTLKIIMCCALTVEEHGHSEKAVQLYDSMAPVINAKLMSEPSSLANLPFLALVAGFRFLSNDEVLAWRVMGQVARLCLEQGLHRAEGIAKIAGAQAQRSAINTFWSAYVLDRRWSFGTGLPYVLHDDKIDPDLPMPDEHPYLVAMITYARLGAKIWRLVDFFEPAIIRDLARDEFERLDGETLQWYASCPEAVRTSGFGTELPRPATPAYNLQRMQIWTRLLLNQIRIWLYTPVLHSASSISANMPQAQRVVDLAKDTIRYLDRLNSNSSLYRRLQVFYHQFLTSSIAVLFLASTHQPVHFSPDCRDEFYMAMNLVKELSAKSWISQRLWRTIRSLKAYAPSLGLAQGLTTRDDNDDDGSRLYSAAADLSLFHIHPSSSSSSSDGACDGASKTLAANTLSAPPNGLQIQAEMTRIYEDYMSVGGIPAAGSTADTAVGATTDYDGVNASDSPSSSTNAVGEGIYEKMKSMF